MKFETIANKLLENRFGGGFVVENKILRVTVYYGKHRRTWTLAFGKAV
jgi:hypothetical protein